MNPLTTSETEAILTLCLIASFADGDKHDREREQLKRITGSLASDGVDLTALSVMGGAIGVGIYTGGGVRTVWITTGGGVLVRTIGGGATTGGGSVG